MRRTLEFTVSGVLSQIISISHPHVSSAKKSNKTKATNQVIRLDVQKRHLCAVVLFFLFVSSSFAYPNPRIEAQKGKQPGAVYFRTDCRPLTDEQLQKRMGPYFDSSRMASSAERLRLGAKADAVQGDFNDEEDMEDFQGDDPDALQNDVLYDEDDVDEEFIEEKEDGDIEEIIQHYKYMRKRRGVSNRDPERGSHVTKRGLDLNTLHLKLALSGRKNKGYRSHESKSRKQLKKELREKVRKSNKVPPWECVMEPVYKRTRDGIFPRFITDGKCVTDKCYFRIYNCVPKKYKIILLERDPERCNPVPVIGTNTTYEEKWYFTNYFVTVGCNCERRKPKKKRRH